MPADNLLNVNLPPIQWTTGTAAHEPQRDPAEGREKQPQASAREYGGAS
jgi:hypothetical protein